MPVITIEAPSHHDPSRIDRTLALVVEELARALPTVPDNVWAHFAPMAAVCEGSTRRGPADVHVIVTVLANPRPEDSIARGLEAIGGAVARGLEVPIEMVWVHWVDLPAGRVLAGGKVG